MAVRMSPAPTLGPAFTQLYREQVGFVWRMLLHFGVPESGVEDAAQDVFVVVHRRWADLHAHVSARSWLYGIARRVASDHRRSRARHERKLEALPPPAGEGLELTLVRRELLAGLERSLAELEPARREVFVLAEIEGMTAREIAEALDVNPNTVSTRLRAARMHVAAAFAQLDREEVA